MPLYSSSQVLWVGLFAQLCTQQTETQYHKDAHTHKHTAQGFRVQCFHLLCKNVACSNRWWTDASWLAWPSQLFIHSDVLSSAATTSLLRSWIVCVCCLASFHHLIFAARCWFSCIMYFKLCAGFFRCVVRLQSSLWSVTLLPND